MENNANEERTFIERTSTVIAILQIFKSKLATSLGLAFGVVLILLFPFGVLAYFASLDLIGSSLISSGACKVLASLLHHNGDGCASQTSLVKMLQSHQWWEAIAFFWTVLFTCLFLWLELPDQYEALNKAGNGRWSSRLSVIVTLIMSLSIALYFNGLGIFHPDYTTALMAKVLLASTFVGVNIAIARRATEMGLHNIAAEFTAYNRNIDLPTCLALFLLLIWDKYIADHDIGNLPEFVAGASSVVLITTGFLFGISVLRNTPENDTSKQL